jgi:hypothetical protein
MKIHHLVKVYFQRRYASIDQAWLDKRFRFFAEHTLKSLESQTVKDWRLWFCCDRGMEDMVGGLYRIAPPGSVFSFYGDNLPVEVPECDYVYVTRIDSDDLYSSDALEIVRAVPPHPYQVSASMFRRGYIHDIAANRTGVYNSPSTPFHTLMFPRAIFADQQKYFQAFVGDHSKICSAYPHKILPDWKFTVLIHGDNFLSTFNYAREKDVLVERGWNESRFIQRSVVFDVDDFCDEHNCLPDLLDLKLTYPDFRCTLFTIPRKTSPALLALASKYNWIELAVHGLTHEPNEELTQLTPAALLIALREQIPTGYVKGFRPPGWFITAKHIDALNRVGYWVAPHLRDRELGRRCEAGCYIVDERLPAWHGHTHDVCDNWLHKAVPELKLRWPKDQAFSFVSDAVLVRPKE